MSTAGFAFPKPTPRAKERRRLKRHTPLRSSGPIRWTPPELDPEDELYRDFVHGEPCVGLELDGHVCWSPDPDEHPIDASHVGARPGMGLKASMRTTIPKCRRLHLQWHAWAGPFKVWTLAERRRWGDAHVARLNAKYDAVAA